MALAIVPLLMVVIGLLVYALASHAVAKESGRLCLFAGFIGIAVAYATHMVHLG